MLYLSSLCKVVLNSWVTAFESDALNHLIPVNMNASGLRKEQVWGKKRDNVISMSVITHIRKQKNHLLHFQILVTQLTIWDFFSSMKLESS